MLNFQIRFALSACFLVVAITPNAAEPRKGHSDYLASLSERSLKAGFPAPSAQLLDVVPGPGREVAAKAIITRLHAGEFGKRLQLQNLKQGPADTRIGTFLSESGYAEVIADGSKLRVRGAIDDRKAIAGAGSTRLEKKELEELGRRLLREAFAPLVPIGKGETLTFLGVRYLYNGAGRTTGATKTQVREQVVANIAVFGREVNGLPVVGSGSKIALWFDNARELVGFDIDWPTYRVSTQVQQTLSQDELAQRVAATTIPLQGTKDAVVRRFECGYVDLGATRRAKTIQTGCSIAFESRSEEAWGRVEYVPAGRTVLQEARWPLANAIAAGDVVNTASDGFNRYLNSPKAPSEAPAKPR